MSGLSAVVVAASCAGGVTALWTSGGTGRARLGRLRVGSADAPASPVERLARQAVNRRTAVIGLASVTVLSAALLGSSSLAVLGVAGALGAPYAVRAREAARRDARLRAELPIVLTAIAGELRAGRPVAGALAAAAVDASPGLARRLSAARDALNRGTDVAGVLAEPSDAYAHALRPLAAVVSLTGSGARLATLIERLAATARADARVRDTVRAELAGPTASATLLAALPALGLVLAAGTGEDPVAVLTGSPLGVGCLLVGVALDVAGLMWSRHIVRSVTGPW